MVHIELKVVGTIDDPQIQAVIKALSDVAAVAAVSTEETKPEETSKAKKKRTSKVEATEEKQESTTVEKEEEAKDLTIDDVRKVFADAKRAGATNTQLKGVLKDFGATSVSGLDPKTYAKVIKAIKSL